MNPFIKRFTGIRFIIFAIIGILISLGGIYAAWQVRSSLSANLFETTELVNSTLSTTYNGMNVLNDTLDEAMDTIESTERVMFAMAQTMGDINEFTSNFLGNLPIRIPGLQRPEDSSEGDSPINNFAVVETEMENIAGNFRGINSAMIDAQGVVSNYQNVIIITQEQIDSIQTNGPKWISTITWGLTIFMVWFAITQIGFIVQGLEFIRSAGEQRVEVNGDPPDR